MDFIIDILRALEAGIVAAAAAVGIGAMIFWRREVIGRRKVELAEQTIVAAYKFRDEMRYVRSVGSVGPLRDEANDRPRSDSETEDEARLKDLYYPTIKRLHEGRKIFADLYALRYRFGLYFGDECKDAFEALWDAREKIRVRAQMLLQNVRTLADPNRHTQPDWNARRTKWEGVIWEGFQEGDPMAATINDAVAKIEGSCRRELQGTNFRLWRFWK